MIKRLFFAFVLIAVLGGIATLIALRILSRPRVAPAPFGPTAPIPDEEPSPLSSVEAEAEAIIVEAEYIELEITEASERLEAEIEEALAAGAALGDATDAEPYHAEAPPISEVTGEPPAPEAVTADTEPAHAEPPPVSDVTGEPAEAVVVAEESLTPTETVTAPPDEQPAVEPLAVDIETPPPPHHPEPSPEALVDEPPPATASEESLPPSVEEALATMPPPPAVHRPDRDAESFLDEGNVYFNVGQYGLAIERYGKALALQPDLTAAYYNRANARTRSGEYEAALQDYDRALLLSPNDADALNNRGMLHLYRSNYIDALRDFNAALAIDPTDATVIVNRGLANLHSGDPAAALVDFREAASLDANDAAAHYGASQAAAALGNRDEALRHLRRALELDPAYAREAAADPKLVSLQGDDEFMKLLREIGSRSENR